MKFRFADKAVVGGAIFAIAFGLTIGLYEVPVGFVVGALAFSGR